MLYLIYSFIEKKYKLVKSTFVLFDQPRFEVLYSFEDTELPVARKVLHNLNNERRMNPSI